MIAMLKGRVESIGLDSVVLEVGGVGWLVFVTPRTSGQLHQGKDTSLFTAMVVREDALTLYGFTSTDERDVFQRLLGVSGIGPRIALAALSVLEPDELRNAISSQDLRALQKIPGVGKKSAQRMVLDLADKLGAPQSAMPDIQSVSVVGEQVVAALVGLGWSSAQAQTAVDALSGEGLQAPDLLRAALVYLGGARG